RRAGAATTVGRCAPARERARGPSWREAASFPSHLAGTTCAWSWSPDVHRSPRPVRRPAAPGERPSMAAEGRLMFTGIVEELGHLRNRDGNRFVFEATTVLEDAKIGDSI